MKEYKSGTRNVEARPRSGRLRRMGAQGGTSGGAVVTVAAGEGAGGDDGWKELIAKDPETGMLLLLRSMARLVLGARGKEATDILDAEDISAGTAEPEDSMLVTARAMVEWADRNLLSKARPDSTEHLLGMLGGATFGPFIQSLYAGRGAAIDKDGNAEVESLRVRSYLEVMELIINRLSAIEGDQLLTEADTIDRVEELGDGCYGLYLRSKWEGYFTAQKEGNVLKGIINTLAAGAGTYHTSWMRVNSVNAAANYIEVTAYPDADTPAGRNFPPCADMKVARWGSQTDTTRQSCLYLSSTEGRIVRLTGVTRPIIGPENYGATFGDLPEFVRQAGLPVIEGQDYVYARGIVVQDIVRMDYLGHPVSEPVDRGPWSAEADYYCGALNPSTGVYEVSDVWYMGCRWRCAKTGTHAAPAWNRTDWAMIEGNPAFTVDFAEPDTVYDPDRFDVTLTVVARLYNQDVTADILPQDVQWTRYSEDAYGTERVSSDNAWALRRAGSGKSIRLDLSDLDINGHMPRTVRFTATVTLRDGAGKETDAASASFEY